MILFLFLISCLSMNLLNRYKDRAQWEDNHWVECLTWQDIKPFKCFQDLQDWTECYLIPDGGACLKTGTLLSSQNQIFIQIYMVNYITTEIPIQISSNGNSNNYTLVMTDQTQVFQYQTQLPPINLKIQGVNAFIQRIEVQEECLPNCISCSNQICNTCQENYTLDNNTCKQTQCEDQILSNNNDILFNQIGLIEDYQYIFNVKFDYWVEGCLVPKIYLTDSLNNTTITYILKDEQIQYNQSQLSIQLSQSNYSKCQQIENVQNIVKQCYIVIGLAQQHIIIYSQVVIAQIYVNKNTLAYTQQSQLINLQNTKPQNLLVVSDYFNLTLKPNQRILQFTQIVNDPLLALFQFEYIAAYAEQSQTKYLFEPLQFQSTQTPGSIDYILQQKQGLDMNDVFIFTIFSQLKYNKSDTQQIGNLQIRYFAQNIFTFIQTQNNISYDEVQGWQIALYVLASIATIIMFIVIFRIFYQYQQTAQLETIQKDNIIE